MPRIDTADSGPVRLITVDAPATRNAFTAAMSKDLGAALDAAEADAAVRVVVVTGAGGAFSSGHDLAEVRVDLSTASDPVANRGFLAPATMATPVVAAVEGPAYAAGFILALNCDVRVAARGATFGASGARLGLLPVGGQLSRLLGLLPYAVAFEMLTSATPLSAERAYELGFVTRLTEPGGALDAALEVAHAMAATSPAVARSVKAGLSATLTSGLAAGLAFEQERAVALRALPDAAEGIAAFLERRPPRFPDPPPGW